MGESPLIPGDNVVRVDVLSDGQPLRETAQLVSVEVRRTVNTIPRARLVFVDGNMPEGDFPLSDTDDFKPGAEIEIKAGYDQKTQAIFKGIVVTHGITIAGENEARLVVECRDKAVAMTVARRNANHVDKLDSEIIQDLVQSYGLKADVESTRVKYPELVQYYCTDWDYLLSRAEVNSLLVLVNDGEIVASKPGSSASEVLTVTYGLDLIEFQADLDARTQLSDVTGVAWDPKTQQAVVADGVRADLPAQGNIDSAKLARVLNVESYRLQTPTPLEESALKEWASARLQKAELARIRGRMKIQGSAKATVGSVIEVAGVGKRFNGKLFVSSIEQRVAGGTWTTEIGFGMEPEWFVERSGIVSPPASGVAPGVEGLQVGVVKKLDEDPAGEMRIQVAAPVMQASEEGVWARLAKFYGSNEIGAFFVPEIGDEVVLGYFNNDPSHPVILGSLYSSNRTPPYESSADNFIKAIVTREKLKLEFDDEGKIITILTPAKNRIVVSDEDESILLEDQHGNKVELSASGIVLDSPKDISIQAQGKIQIKAMQEISVSSEADIKSKGLNIKSEAKVGFEAKGNASAELSASGQTTVKGAMVLIN